jgi:hypothetical protein
MCAMLDANCEFSQETLSPEKFDKRGQRHVKDSLKAGKLLTSFALFPYIQTHPRKAINEEMMEAPA